MEEQEGELIMAVEMTTKCADLINVKKYVELEHYLVYVKGDSIFCGEGIYCVNKETGKRELLLDVRHGTVEEYGKIQKDLCIENLCGVGNTLYVFCENYYLKINVFTKEIEQQDVFAGDTRSMVWTPNATKLYPQCNEKYLVYRVSNTLYLVNLITGKTEKVKNTSGKEIYAGSSYRLWEDKIIYIYDGKIYVYDIKTKKSAMLYEPLDGWGVSLFGMNEQTINYDESTVDFYEDTLYLAQYDEEEYVHKIAIISLDGSGDVEELELDIMTDAEEITTKLIKDGCLYYVTANEEAQIVKYDLRSQEETILEEGSQCVISESSGGFRKRIFYTAGSIQIVGNWLYYQDNEGENTHRIPIDGGECVNIKVKK